MTIYKTLQTEKKDEKDPELLTEPLTCEADEIVAPKVVRVTYGPRRTRTYVNLCLIITALLVFGAGIIGAIFLYRHLSHRVITGTCGVTYYDEMYHQEADFLRGKLTDPVSVDVSHGLHREDNNMEGLYSQMDIMKESVEVSEVDHYEKIQIPKFDECEETVVWHDFHQNYTAIVDHAHNICYVIKLNRTLIAPPRDVIDFLIKIKKEDYYLPRAEVVREKYTVVQPPLKDLQMLGYYIMRECFWYETYRLKKIQDGYVKRSARKHGEGREVHYGYLSLHDFKLVKDTIVF